jgi:hypothetical protein
LVVRNFGDRPSHVPGPHSGSPEWSIDELIDQLRATATTGTFADDCSTILMVFD